MAHRYDLGKGLTATFFDNSGDVLIASGSVTITIPEENFRTLMMLSIRRNTGIQLPEPV